MTRLVVKYCISKMIIIVHPFLLSFSLFTNENLPKQLLQHNLSSGFSSFPWARSTRQERRRQSFSSWARRRHHWLALSAHRRLPCCKLVWQRMERSCLTWLETSWCAFRGLLLWPVPAVSRGEKWGSHCVPVRFFPSRPFCSHMEMTQNLLSVLLRCCPVFYFWHFMAFSQHLILQIQFSVHKLLKHADGSTCVFHYWLAPTDLVII